DGRIYALTQQLTDKRPPGAEGIPSPYIADSLLVLSPQGERVDSVPLLEAFQGSPYWVTLLSGAVITATDGPLPQLPLPPFPGKGPPGGPPPLPPPLGPAAGPPPAAPAAGPPLPAAPRPLLH